VAINHTSFFLVMDRPLACEFLVCMGNSVGGQCDRFYDQYLGIGAVTSMSTERAISKLEFQIGFLCNVKTVRINFRLYHYNELPGPQSSPEKSGTLVQKRCGRNTLHTEPRGGLASMSKGLWRRLRKLSPRHKKRRRAPKKGGADASNISSSWQSAKLHGDRKKNMKASVKACTVAQVVCHHHHIYLYM